MESVSNQPEINNLKESKILGLPNLKNSRINFYGKNNILYCTENVNLSNSVINFRGNNSLIILNDNTHPYYIQTEIHDNCVLFIGENNYFNGKLTLILSERKNIIIGNSCLISFGNIIRTADPHLIYDCNTKRRINPSKSVYIGDHVWIGQNTLLLKGSIIGSGSIVGANSVISGKRIQSNCVYAGNPARKIREDVFFTNQCVHRYQEKDTLEHEVYQSEEFIYSYEPKVQIDISTIEQNLSYLTDAEEKRSYLECLLMKHNHKNRFFIMG